VHPVAESIVPGTSSWSDPVPHLRPSARHGLTLAEMLVALLLLQLAGIGALSAALTADRIGRRAGLAARTDGERWAALRAAEIAPGCADSGVARAGSVSWPSNAVRPAAVLLIRCGR
jgi:Tfp pilus assembly protein PilX